MSKEYLQGKLIKESTQSNLRIQRPECYEKTMEELT